LTGDASALCFDLSGFRIMLRAVPAEVAERLIERWSDFRVPHAPDPIVDLTVRVEGDEGPDGPLDPRGLRVEREAAAAPARFVEGSLELTDDGSGLASLAPGRAERQYWVLVNLVCAALGRRAIERGAVLLHAAAVVIEGRAFVMVAPEGGGKTTWAELARDAGALYVSDDVVLVDGSRGAFEVLTTPIRGNHPRPLPPGRWPLAALLLPRHGDAAAAAPASRLASRARLEANVLFAARRAIDRGLGSLLDRLAAGTPAFELTFRRDASFMPALRQLAGSHPRP
jgi:hypothetical protein